MGLFYTKYMDVLVTLINTSHTNKIVHVPKD